MVNVVKCNLTLPLRGLMAGFQGLLARGVFDCLGAG